MKHLFLALFTVSTLVACSPAPDDARVEPGPAVCEDGPRSPGAVVDRKVAVLGSTANALRRDGDAVWIVESGSNTVSRFDLQTQSLDVEVDVGNERNPWDVWVGPEHVWITNFLADTVTVADRETGVVVDEISHDSFDGPAGITGTGDRVYVGNTQFRGDGDYGAGSVTVIDRTDRTVFGARPTVRQNPQSLAVVGDRVVVVDSGAIEFDGGSAFAGSEAAVELFAETDDPLEPDVDVALLGLVEDRRVGIPGHPAHLEGSGELYFASGTAPVIFVLDLASARWRRGSDDPIRLYETDGDALHHAAMGPGGVLYVTSFNDDALYLVDTTCDAVLGDPIELDGSEFLAGPHGVVPVKTEDGVDAWFALTNASELGRVRFNYD